MKYFLKLLLSTSLFVILVAPSLLVILIFFIYRTLVFINLKINFKSNFGGLLTGSDVLFAADITSRNVINIIMIARTKDNFQEFTHKFKNVVNERVFKNPENDPKLLSTHHKSCGYHYFIHDQVEIDKCVRTTNWNWQSEEISKEELFKEISRYSNQPLPYNNTGFWEFLLCEKPVIWKNSNNKVEKSYAVLLRFHHCLADGISLLNLMLNIFSDSHGEAKIENLPITENKWFYNFERKIRDILGFLYILLITPMVLLSEIFFQNVDDNGMKVSSLSDRQILVAKTEDSSKCLKIIKAIRRKVEDTSFVHVLAVAISKGFGNYFQKRGKDINLSSINGRVTVLMEKLHYLQFPKIKSIKLRNRFSIANLNIPIIYNTEEPSCSWQSFMQSLKKVKMGNKYSKALSDCKVLYGVGTVVSYFCPESIVLLLHMMLPNTNLLLGITNLPAPSAMTPFGDCLIEDIVVWVPRVKQFGLTLGILSYDERLQIALNVDKEILSNECDAQDIVDGIYQALIELDGKI